MAPPSPRPGSPLRTEDLLSEAKWPPLSGREASLLVTSQLYASLHRSRQAEAEARAQLQGPLGSPTSPSSCAADHRGQLDTLDRELSRSLTGGSQHISAMESVRSHLQSMLQASRETAHHHPLVPPGGPERREEDSFDSDSTGTLLNARPLQELSPPSSAAGLDGLFPRCSSLWPGSSRDQPELQGLKDALDTEHTRRRHCERHIQSLQTRVLELQQQLAVALAADRKKDLMIEQLDKTLARVVEGWNRHEAERVEVLRGLQEERQAAELTRGQQQETVARLEQSLSQAMEALSLEQKGASQQQREREMLEEARLALTRSLEREQQRSRSLQAERDEALAGRLGEQRELESLRAALEEQAQAQAQRERQQQDQCQALCEEARAQLERERASGQREAQVAQETRQQLSSAQADVRRLEEELDTARRERDGLQLENSLIQARCEAQRVQIESKLAVQLEQQMTERLAQVHEGSLRQVTALREQHRKHVQELTGQHQEELATQLAQFKAELAEQEARQQHVAQDYELRLAREQARVRELRSGHQRLEAQRAETVGRLQAMLRAHWEEAHRLLSGSAPPGVPPAPLSNCPGLAAPGTEEEEEEEEEGRPWSAPPPATALKPVLQQSRGPEEPGPLSLGRCPSPDLSSLLGPSFLSQQSFQPLEPQPDITPPPAGSIPSAQQAERPFPEEQGGPAEPSSLSPASLDELKQYLHLLLDPFSGKLAPPDQDNPPVTQLLSQPGPPGSPQWKDARSIPRPPPAVHKTKVPLAKTTSLFWGPEAPRSPTQGRGGCGGQARDPPGSPEKGREGDPPNSQQLSEASRLLRLCQAQGQAGATEELLAYLRRLEERGRTEGQGDAAPRRNTDFRLGEAPRREPVLRRLTHKVEKPPGRKKAGPPVPGSTRNRGGIWR
ncbi:centrobin isoform X2 [Tachyglossus aculeatus]|uniref:centrobin isoform X2 n=1 Tax=Tachyglossus aculeatus TaxID=9261 RepID=UPI0018F53685|nr:centrobin isoform X2 [Tachyglossus aculeatus]